jgi:hypothetical protein
MKIIKALFFSIGLITLAGSCTSKFDAMNVSPNDPTAISPQYLLPYALEASIDRYWGVRTRFERLNLDGAMCWMQYLTRNIYSNEGDNYEVSVGFYTNNWKGFFNDGQVNYQRIIALAGPGGKFENANYEGVALVMRAWVFSLLTDVYGPIPYTDALKGTAESPNYSPVYDPVETVYAGLLKDLKTANEKLSVTGTAIAGDIVYGGDILKWKKFANSLRLKLANRQAVKKSAESKAIMAEILGNATTYPIFTTNADNAILKNSAVLPSNNEWNQVMIQDGRTDWNISKTLADRLNELGDSRITIYAQPNKVGKYEGHPNGLPDAVATNYLSSSSLLGTYFTATTAPAVIMTLSELNLILAEAAFDGDISGSAQTYMEKGIAASFDQYGLTVPAGYLTKVGAATKATIMEQKWISLFGQAIEAWTEYRRTGLPVLPAKDSRSVFSNDGVLPTRLKYPTSEYSLNKASLDKGITLLGGADDMKSKLWWVEK